METGTNKCTSNLGVLPGFSRLGFRNPKGAFLHLAVRTE